MLNWITRAQMLLIPAQEISSPAAAARVPTVSVVMMTRNHEQYVEQAVASILAQKCAFQYEILIGEDKSADNTRAICESLQARYPDVIRLIVAPVNVGITANFLRLIARARGKYAAFLEGDDYWTAADKLEKQVALMEAHPEYSWCGARTGNRTFWAKVKSYYDLEDILRRYIFHTSSVLFRKEILNRYPAFPDNVCWESMLFGYLSEHGKCGFLDQEVSYYLWHPGGLWSSASLDSRMQMTWACIDALDGYFEGKYSKELADRELWIYGMDTKVVPGPEFWSHWRQSLVMAGKVMRRLMRRDPAGYVLFASTVLVHPLTAGYLVIRRRLALRRRLTALQGWVGRE